MSDKKRQMLQNFWKYPDFRPGQEEIIDAILQDKDVLAVLPTGGGKSICFQIPALIKPGVCLVITPLVALMKDQTEQLIRRGIPAACIFTGMHIREIEMNLDYAVQGQIKFLYIAPERLQSEKFRYRLQHIPVNFIAIDEAHCISEWGFDFRPSYRKIAEIREHFPKIKFAAFTGTANNKVKEDIVQNLKLQTPTLFIHSFERKNISFSCLDTENKEEKLISILKKINAPAIVYVRNRNKTQYYAQLLYKNGVSADFYHAGLNQEDRSRKQNLWVSNKFQTMVATNAFGMGIDKPDVRIVVHMDIPENPEAYYQEAGRAGRDGQKAYAIILFHQKDIDDMKLRVERKYPEPDVIRHTYQCLANYYKIALGSSEMASYDFNEEHFIKTYQLDPSQTFYSLKKLEQEGYILLSDSFHQQSKIMIPVNQTDLYDFQLTHRELDSFIKLILRMYGGEMFSYFVAISENMIAHHARINKEEVEKKLQYLHQLQLIIYNPAQKNNQIVFTMPRQDAARMQLNLVQYRERLKHEQKTAEFMAEYVRCNECRSKYLRTYFDEITNDTCGICDHCTKTVKTEKSSWYRSQILERTENEALLPKALFDSFPLNDKEFITAALKELLDEGLITYNSVGELIRVEL